MAALKFGDKILTSAGGTPLWAYTTVEIAGAKYRTVRLGGLEWLAEGLKYLPAGYTLFDSVEQLSSTNPEAKDGIRNGVARISAASVQYDPIAGYMYTHYAPDAVEADLPSIAPGWRIPTKPDFYATIAVTGGIDESHIVAGNQYLGDGARNWRANGGVNGDYTYPALNRFGLNFVIHSSSKASSCWAKKTSTTARDRFLVQNQPYWHKDWYMSFGPTTGSARGGNFPIRLVRDIS